MIASMLLASVLSGQIVYVRNLGRFTSAQEGTVVGSVSLVCNSANDLNEYFNTTTSKNRCCQSGAWNDCISAGSITGSGAANRCTFWTSASAISSDADCTYNPTTNYLDVNGTIETNALKVVTGATTGYVLTSDLSGNATWQALPPSGISGSGTSGRLPKWSGATALNDSPWNVNSSALSPNTASTLVATRANTTFGIPATDTADMWVNSAGQAVFAYLVGNDIHVWKCDQPGGTGINCAGGTDTAVGITLSTGGLVTPWLVVPGSASVNSGNPTFLYQTVSAGNLKIYSKPCLNDSCTSVGAANLITTLSLTTGPSQQYAGLGAAECPDHSWAIAYRDWLGGINYPFLYTRCANPPTCSSIATVAFSTGVNLDDSSNIRVTCDTTPVVLYNEYPDNKVRVYSCTDSSCGTVSSANIVSTYSGGAPLSKAVVVGGITYVGVGGFDGTSLLKCSDAACSGLSFMASTGVTGSCSNFHGGTSPFKSSGGKLGYVQARSCWTDVNSPATYNATTWNICEDAGCSTRTTYSFSDTSIVMLSRDYAPNDGTNSVELPTGDGVFSTNYLPNAWGPQYGVQLVNMNVATASVVGESLGTQAAPIANAWGVGDANFRDFNASRYVKFGAGPKIIAGAGNPEGSVSGTTGDVYLSTGSSMYRKNSGTNTTTGWAQVGGGANTALSNLAATAVNTNILPGVDDTISLGDNTHRWSDAWLGAGSLHMGTATGDELLMSYDTSTNNAEFTVAGTKTLSIGQGNEIWSDQNANSSQALYLNYRGYQGGLTQFRSTIFGNGKGSAFAKFEGDTSRLGVGTLVPKTLLDVQGTATVNNTLRASDAAGAYAQLVLDGVTGTGATNGVSLALSGTKTMTLDNQAWFPNTTASLATSSFNYPTMLGDLQNNSNETDSHVQFFWDSTQPIGVYHSKLSSQAQARKCTGNTNTDCSTIAAEYAVPNVNRPFDMIQKSTVNGGRPVFGTILGGNITLVSCTNADCSTTSTYTVASAGTSPQPFMSMALSDKGRWMFTWSDNTDLKFAQCTATTLSGTAQCTAGATPVTVAAALSTTKEQMTMEALSTAGGTIDVPAIVVTDGNANAWLYRLCDNGGAGVSCVTEDLTGTPKVITSTLPAASGSFTSPAYNIGQSIRAGNGFMYFSASRSVGLGSGCHRYEVTGYRCTNDECSSYVAQWQDNGNDAGVSFGYWANLTNAGVLAWVRMIWNEGGFCPAYTVYAEVDICADYACSTYNAIPQSSYWNGSYIYIPWLDGARRNLLQAYSATEMPTGDLMYLVFAGNAGNPSQYSRINVNRVNISTLTASGTSIGKGTNKVADITALGTTTTGAVNITGTGSGLGTIKLGNIAADPGSGINGMMYYNTISNTFRCYANSAWGPCGSASTGTLNQVAVFSGPTTTTGDPGLTYDPVTNVCTITHDAAGGGLVLANSDNVAATLKFKEPSTSGSNFAAIKAPALAADYTLTLPVDDGTSGQYLTTDGSGGLSWTSPTAAYGEFTYNNETGTAVTLTSAGTYYAIPASTLVKGNVDPNGNIDSTGTDLTNNRFKVGANGAGDYEVVAQITFTGEANKEYHWIINKNGTTDDLDSRAGVNFEGTTNYGSVTLVANVTLAATDTLELRVGSENASTSVTIKHLSFTIFKPSGGGGGGGGGGTLTVGTSPIASGTVGRILIEGAGNVLQEDADLNWSTTNNYLGLGVTATDTLSIKSHASFTGSEYNTHTAAVQTTDATVTSLAEFTVADTNVCTLEAMVSARKVTGDRASYILRASVYREGGGATLNGTTDVFEKESNTAWDATIDTSSNLVRVRVTGVGSTTINWVGNIRYQCVSGS